MSAKRQSKGKANGVSRKKSKLDEDDTPVLSEEEDDDDRRSDDDDVDELTEDNASLVSLSLGSRWTRPAVDAGTGHILFKLISPVEYTL